MKLLKIAAATALAFGSLASAQAALFLNPGVYTNLSIETFDSIDPAVIVPPGLLVNPSVRVSSTTDSEVGAITSYNLGDNGIWGAYLDPVVSVDGFVGSNFNDGFDPTPGTITFRFVNGPVAAVGAVINAFQATGALPNSFTIAAIGSNFTQLETYTVSVDTAFDSYNEGKFFGIVRPTADIIAFSISDGSVVVDDLQWAVSPVPEPSEYAMLFAGLGIVSLIARRRRRV